MVGVDTAGSVIVVESIFGVGSVVLVADPGSPVVERLWWTTMEGAMSSMSRWQLKRRGAG